MSDDEGILIYSNNTNNDILYYPKTDDIVNRKDGKTRNLFKSRYTKIWAFPGTNLFHLGYEYGDANLVMPHKLKHLGFKDYSFKKTFIMTTYSRKKKKRGSRNPSEEERYIHEYDLLEFHDDAEYAFFYLLMSDLINNSRYVDSTIDLVDVSATVKGI
jgi:hypothetical protein